MWFLSRSDADAADESDVIDSLGEFLAQVLGPASPIESRGMFEVLQLPGEGHRWAIGAANPVTLESIEQPDTPEDAFALPRPSGEQLGSFEECETLRTLDAQAPWYMTISFDWRAPDTQIEWPRRATTAGIPHTADEDLEWLLISAAFQGTAQKPPTSMAGAVADAASEQADKVIESAKRAFSGWGTALAVGLGLATAIGIAVAIQKRRT